MSELTQCNFCSLRQIKCCAVKDGGRVVKRLHIGSLGGIDIYVVPRDVEVPKVIVADNKHQEGDAFHKKYFTGWFMELTDHCVC